MERARRPLRAKEAARITGCKKIDIYRELVPKKAIQTDIPLKRGIDWRGIFAPDKAEEQAG
jgi:hypothetical protein